MDTLRIYDFLILFTGIYIVTTIYSSKFRNILTTYKLLNKN